MVLFLIPRDEVCFVQNLVDWAFGMVGSFVQNAVEKQPTVESTGPGASEPEAA